jgi:hypothetical protein
MPSPPATGQYKVTRATGQDFVNPQNVSEIITLDKDESIILETWFKDGLMHRDNGPAITEFYPNSSGARLVIAFPFA